MIRILLTTVLIFGSVGFAASQEIAPRPSMSTTVPNTVRYEMVQVPFQSGYVTLRLDKLSGRTFHMTLCPQRNIIGSALCWKETTVIELPKPTTDGAVRYQIFAQGEANRYIVLSNIVSGQSWQLGLEDGLYKWTPFVDPVVLPQSFEIVR